jgi:thiamine-monophosphate kinase
VGERDWISKYFRPLAVSPGADGLNDDVAELSLDRRRTVINVDALVESVHFLSSDPIETIARKLVRTNVSDIIAKGARPHEAVLTLGWPKDRDEAQLARFAAALGDELSHWGARLIGGDTTASPNGLFLSLTLTGLCGRNGPIRRSGAQTGDELWVTGEIGAACRGFRALQAGQAESPWVSAYREPELAPLSIIELVQAYARAAMDVSDGLLGDARTLSAASACALNIDLGAVPFAGGADNLEERLALATWGDDYQVLFAVPAASADQLKKDATELGIGITRIGRFNAGAGLSAHLEGISVNLPETMGFEHG